MLLVSNMVTAITKVVVPSFVTTLIFYYNVYFTNTIFYFYLYHLAIWSNILSNLKYNW